MARQGAAGKLRIIGGQWRGRKLPVADLPGLRPTTDRVRETLFNWLAPTLAGSHCLDLFAGSGALGLEALSRGAASCCFVERQRRAAQALEKALETLNARDRGRVLQEDALAFAARQSTAQRFDLVFLDPPFDGDLLQKALHILADGALLAADALIYVEHARQREPEIPEGWECWRGKRSGEVVYGLYRAA